jgi:hypothetical protein
MVRFLECFKIKGGLRLKDFKDMGRFNNVRVLE